jgi:nicotinamide riboside kinase
VGARRSRAAGAGASRFYLLCDTDIPWAPDPQRRFPDAVTRDRARRHWRVALESRGLPVAEVAGAGPDRERAAIAAVEQILRA